MAYFSNGMEGMLYEEHYCEKCLHYGDGDTKDICPVWLLHLTYNGTQVAAANRVYGGQPVGDDDSAVAYQVLSELIPRTGTFPQQCRMLIPVNDGEI